MRFHKRRGIDEITNLIHFYEKEQIAGITPQRQIQNTSSDTSSQDKVNHHVTRRKAYVLPGRCLELKSKLNAK